LKETRREKPCFKTIFVEDHPIITGIYIHSRYVSLRYEIRNKLDIGTRSMVFSFENAARTDSEFQESD